MANTIFSQKEIEYIKSQRLARADVVPVGFDFEGDYFYVGEE
jgi:hypothetical protein